MARRYRRNRRGFRKNYSSRILGARSNPAYWSTNIFRNKVSRGVYRGSSRPYYIKRTTRSVASAGPIIQNQATTDSPYAFTFKFSDLPVYSELAALFDNYQITCIVIRFEPVKNQLNFTTTGSIEVPKIGLAYDYDDGSIPVSLDQLRQYATYREYACTDAFTVKIYPKVSVAVYNGLTTGYLRPSSKLQRMFKADCAYPDIEHYGLKMIIADTNSGTQGIWAYTYSATYYLKMSGLI